MDIKSLCLSSKEACKHLLLLTVFLALSITSSSQPCTAWGFIDPVPFSVAFNVTDCINTDIPFRGTGSIAISNDDTLYRAIVSMPVNSDYRIIVMKHNGLRWLFVGDPLDHSISNYELAMDIDPQGTPYVAFSCGGKEIDVRKYDGTNWVRVGQLDGGTVRCSNTSISIIKKSDTAYLSYCSNSVIYVKKFNRTSWAPMASFSGYNPTLDKDCSNSPYISYKTSNTGNINVVKIDGSNIVSLGAVGITGLGRQAMAMHCNVPYVAYSDAANAYKVTVKKYNGQQQWILVGDPGFSAGAASNVSLQVNAADVPYVSYVDNEGQKLMRYDGTTWVPVGNPLPLPFGIGTVTGSQMVLNNDTPYIFGTGPVGGRNMYPGFVQACGFVLPITGNHPVCIRDLLFLRTGTPNGTWKSADTSIASVDVDGIVTAISPGTTLVSYTVPGCLPASVTVIVNDRPPLLNTLNTICYGSSATLTISGGVRYDWYPTTGLSDTTTASVIASPTENTVYTGTAINEKGCRTYNKKTVIVNPFWGITGNPGFSTIGGAGSSIAIGTNDPNGVLYVGYPNANNRATVMMYDKNNANFWKFVGPESFGTSPASSVTVACSRSGVPYVVCWNSDAQSWVPTVMRCVGNNWISLGSDQLNWMKVLNISLVINNETPYIAFTDYGNSGNGKGTVMQYNGTAWVSVGIPGFTPNMAGNLSLAFSSNGTPYLAYQDLDGVKDMIRVMKFDGTNWVAVGSSGVIPSPAVTPSIAILNDVPYVALGDGESLSVMKYNSSSNAWDVVGYRVFSPGRAQSMTLAFVDTTPYVSYTDIQGTQMQGRVMKYDGTNWIAESQNIAPMSGVVSNALAVNNKDLYVVFNDGTQGYKTSVQHLNRTTHPIFGSQSVIAGNSTTFTAVVSGGYWGSSDQSVATIDQNTGVLKALTPGTTVISYNGFGCGFTLTTTVTSANRTQLRKAKRRV